MQLDRRLFLKGAGGTALGLVFAPACESNQVRPKGIGREFDFLTPVDASLEGDPGRRPTDAFYLQWGAESTVDGWTYADQPVIAPDEWSLRIEGLVQTPLDITFADLERKAAAGEEVVLLNTLRCIFDTTDIPGLVGNALWRGVPLRSVLEDAGIDPQQTARIRYFGRDGFANNLRLEDVFLPDALTEPLDPLLVYEMNGEPVPHVHGGPVRLLTPGRYGYKNVKWIERVVATDDDSVFGQYQSVFGFFDAGTIQPITKVTNPLTEAEIPAGPFDVFGYALSGLAGITTVEVSIDGGPFEATELVPLEDIRTSFPVIDASIQVASGATYPFRSVWTLFRYAWDAPPGEHTLRFRATDAAGNVQPEEDDDPTDGTTAYWRVTVRVV
jgi:DMSO/TMAO reductase YedYZ molybdopterin-dependent catalytic subunit